MTQAAERVVIFAVQTATPNIIRIHVLKPVSGYSHCYEGKEHKHRV